MKDLLLTAAGDLDVSRFDVHLVDGSARVAQQVKVTLKSFLGEFDYDLSFGIGWRQDILGVKPVNLRHVQDLLQEKILAVADVRGIAAFTLGFDAALRSLSIDCILDTTFGPAAGAGSFP